LNNRLIEPRNPEKCYGFTHESHQKYLEGMAILSSTTIIWPHPIETLWGGQKVVRMGKVARISANLGTEVPLIATIASPDDLDRLDLRNVVIKRTYSECGEHVFYGRNMDRKALSLTMDMTHERWFAMPAEYQPVWFVQPFMPTIQEKLELRIVCVGRIPLYGVVIERGNHEEPDKVGQFLWAAPLNNVL
jgi:hypothetical protein